MYVTRAFTHQAEFEAEAAQAARSLGPEVVRVDTELGYDWAGEPSVFFMVILDDAVTTEDRLLGVTNRVSRALDEKTDPLERWGLRPYFNFRARSEQDKIDRRAA